MEDDNAYVMRLAKDGNKIGDGPFSIKSGGNFELVVDNVPNYIAVMWQSAQNTSTYLLLQISHRGGEQVKSLKCFICAAPFNTMLTLIKHYDEAKCKRDKSK